MNGNNKCKEFCPFISKPQNDCYCMKLQSEYTEKIIYYCQENYKKCEVYIKMNKSRKKHTGIHE